MIRETELKNHPAQSLTSWASWLSLVAEIVLLIDNYNDVTKSIGFILWALVSKTLKMSLIRLSKLEYSVCWSTVPRLEQRANITRSIYVTIHAVNQWGISLWIKCRVWRDSKLERSWTNWVTEDQTRENWYSRTVKYLVCSLLPVQSNRQCITSIDLNLLCSESWNSHNTYEIHCDYLFFNGSTFSVTSKWKALKLSKFVIPIIISYQRSPYTNITASRLFVT